MLKQFSQSNDPVICNAKLILEIVLIYQAFLTRNTNALVNTISDPELILAVLWSIARPQMFLLDPKILFEPVNLSAFKPLSILHEAAKSTDLHSDLLTLAFLTETCLELHLESLIVE